MHHRTKLWLITRRLRRAIGPSRAPWRSLSSVTSARYCLQAHLLADWLP